MTRRRVVLKNKNKEIIGQIMGGLGNQLFIIFTTISYALKHNMDYSILNIERARKSYFDKDIYKNIKVFNKSLGGYKLYKEPHFHYKEIPKMDKIVLHGYYQSPKYFDNYRNVIIKMLELDEVREKYKILNKDGFLHFRIGDYKKTECHPVCDLDYYIKALDKINVIDINLNFVYYFEEENKNEVEEKVNILRKKFKDFTFTPIDNKLEDYQQMLSMTDMKYCIIANSSFSWWGAYLNDRKDKVVFYPNKWFEGSLKETKKDDLFLENWIKI